MTINLTIMTLTMTTRTTLDQRIMKSGLRILNFVESAAIFLAFRSPVQRLCLLHVEALCEPYRLDKQLDLSEKKFITLSEGTTLRFHNYPPPDWYPSIEKAY